LFNTYLLKILDFLFADDIKIFRTVKSATDCTILESDSDTIRDWCAANCTKINIDKFLYLKIISTNDNYKLCDKCMIAADSTSDPRVLLDAKHTFHHHVVYMRRGAVKSLARLTSQYRRTESWKTAGFRLNQ
jgi:hypothetical protein